jgi:hypothetical protein
MQAIVVKYLGPTNRHGSRYKATAQAGSKTIEADQRLNGEDNARNACYALRDKLGWTAKNTQAYGGIWALGFLPDGSYVFVNPNL